MSVARKDRQTVGRAAPANQRERHMNRILPALALTIAFAAPALASKKQCNIVGAFTDSLGSSGEFTSQTMGTVSNTAICPSTYKLTVTKLSTKVINIKGKTTQCGNLVGKFKFQDGGCTTAKGTVTITGIGTFPDTVTRSGAEVARKPSADTSRMTNGLK